MSLVYPKYPRAWQQTNASFKRWNLDIGPFRDILPTKAWKGSTNFTPIHYPLTCSPKPCTDKPLLVYCSLFSACLLVRLFVCLLFACLLFDQAFEIHSKNLPCSNIHRAKLRQDSANSFVPWTEALQSRSNMTCNFPKANMTSSFLQTNWISCFQTSFKPPKLNPLTPCLLACMLACLLRTAPAVVTMSGVPRQHPPVPV